MILIFIIAIFVYFLIGFGLLLYANRNNPDFSIERMDSVDNMIALLWPITLIMSFIMNTIDKFKTYINERKK
jgi:hypothetical protein